MVEAIRNILRGGPYRGPMPRPPFWMVVAFLVLVVFTWVPLVFIGRARVSKSSQPRFHAQDVNPLFLDNRAMRPRLPGTVAWGKLHDDDRRHRGFQRVRAEDGEGWQVQFIRGLPDGIELDMNLLRRGQTMYGVFCASCHGHDGYGDGVIMQRAEQLGAGWIAQNLHLFDDVAGKPQFGPELYEDGRLFNTITHGKGTMPAMGRQIKVDDRWAIVAYVRALQRSQFAKEADVPPAIRESLE
jgi:mono/diheme cytochrome c family protein